MSPDRAKNTPPHRVFNQTVFRRLPSSSSGPALWTRGLTYALASGKQASQAARRNRGQNYLRKKKPKGMHGTRDLQAKKKRGQTIKPPCAASRFF